MRLRITALPFPKFGTLEKSVPKLVFRADYPRLISKRFSNFFSSYSQSFNKEQKRMGSLFMKNFKRKKIDSQEYLLNVVRYIHQNPVEAGLCDYPNQWQFSSYIKILTENSGFVQSKEVIDWFDDLENFKAFHKIPESLTEESLF